MGHVRGGWAGHVCLPVGGAARRELAAVGRVCAEVVGDEAAGGVVEELAEPHISLTRPFYVQEHQIAGVVRALEAAVADISPFAVGFGAVSTYRNSGGGGGGGGRRWFVAADVDAGAAA
ncbi:poly(U)-specific 3'-to-5' RNA exonuclease, partial [Coemansia helicoidea]